MSLSLSRWRFCLSEMFIWYKSSMKIGFRTLRGCEGLLEKFLVANIVVRMAPFNFRRALNFFRQSTVSWRWIADATRSRCWKIIKLDSISISRLKRKGKRKSDTYRYPRMFESFRSGDAFMWVHSQHLIDKVFGLRCDCIPLGLWILSKRETQVNWRVNSIKLKVILTSYVPALICAYNLCWSSSQNGG